MKGGVRKKVTNSITTLLGIVFEESKSAYLLVQRICLT